MAMEHYFEDEVAHYESNGENKSYLGKWKSVSDAVAGSDDNSSGGFDCNICLESVQDPVVTLCGHLYCWPCIYKWLHFQSISTEDEEQKQQQCPVCKAEVSHTTLVPLYGRGQTKKSSKGKAPHLGIVIPQRPLGPGCRLDTPRLQNPTFGSSSVHHRNYPHQSQMNYPQQGGYPVSPTLDSFGTTTNSFDPMIGMFGEMIYARVFGSPVTNMYTYPNSYHFAGVTSARVRRHVMQADKSLSRICFFLFCCILLCLLLF